jgi:hypothetical protein
MGTLLQRLIIERQLTRQQALDILKRRALDMDLDREFTLSLRELDRLLHGELKGSPHPVRARVIEAEFGYRVRDLSDVDDGTAVPLHAGVDRGVPVPTPGDIRRLVHNSAIQSTEFGEWADSLALGDLALTTLWLRVEEAATGYVHAPMVPIFCELQALRDHLFGLLGEPDPGQVRDLYMLAGVVCGLMAHASGNLGDLRAAHMQANTALVCAKHADHPTLAAWVYGVRALQCEWNGRPDETLLLTGKAQTALAREGVPSTVGVWIAAIEARACARLGRPQAALHAIRRTAEARDKLPAQREARSDLDRLGGVLSFPMAKQLYYVGSAYRRIGRMAEAEASSMQAITDYARGPAEERSYGDEAIARIDVTIARASADRPDLEGAMEGFRSLAAMPTCLCLPTMTGPLRDLDAALSNPRLRGSTHGAELREAVRAVLNACEDTTGMITP